MGFEGAVEKKEELKENVSCVSLITKGFSGFYSDRLGASIFTLST